MTITIILALVWALAGVVTAAIDHHRRGLDFTIGDLLFCALMGALVPLLILGLLDIVIWRRK